MTGSVTASVDSAYGTLARLKIALPLAQAAVSRGDSDAGSTVITLVDLTRDLTDRLASTVFSTLERLDVSRRERLLRSIAQDVAYLIGRAHERDEEIDAAKLIAQVRLAHDVIDQVPGARLSPFFDDSLDAQAQWQLAVSRASARLVESLMVDARFAQVHGRDLLKDLLDRVERSADRIETQSAEEHRTVRLSLLAQFAKSHSRLIFIRLLGARDGERMTPERLLATLDAYHETIGAAVSALTGESPSSAAVPRSEIEHDFTPTI